MNKITQRRLDTLHRRMASMEKQLAERAEKAAQVKHSAAFGRLFDALHIALPPVREGYNVRSKEHVAAIIWVPTRTVDFEDLLYPLAERIEAGTVTDADKAILDQLPADALEAIDEPSASSFVVTVAGCHKRLNEKY
ncbi:hypothetical protein [Undibacterium sp. Xuan67W]|uniref:hypothetical protein n=1 Tax=Undibacterium sp. Xuan67W TaxID=3413057 RepID=UPI003BF3A1FB